MSSVASNISLIGGNWFSGTGGAELRQYDVGSNTVVHLDANGDAIVDLEVVLVGNITLTQGDLT